MVKYALGLPHVSEAKFIHQVVADRPRVTEVPLLESLFSVGAEARYVGACSLEVVKGFEYRLITKIVVGGQLLFIVQAVIETDGELIVAVMPSEHCLKEAIGCVRIGNKSKQVCGDRILTRSRDNVVGKDIRVSHTLGRRDPTRGGDGSRAFRVGCSARV